MQGKDSQWRSPVESSMLVKLEYSMKQIEPEQELPHSIQNHGKLGTHGEARANRTVVLSERRKTPLPFVN